MTEAKGGKSENSKPKEATGWDDMDKRLKHGAQLKRNNRNIGEGRRNDRVSACADTMAGLLPSGLGHGHSVLRFTPVTK